MTDSQENSLSRYEAVDLIFGNNEEVYNHTDAFVAYVTEFKGNITEIHTVAGEQGEIRTGAAVDKSVVRDNLENATIKVKNGVRALGVFTGNNRLRDSASYADSELKSFRDNVLADHAGNIHKIASGVAAQLEPYFVTAADIQAVSTFQKQFLDLIATPRYETVLTKDATRTLKVLFRETDTLLREKIDPTILIFKPAYPEFVNNYFDARIIVDLGRRKTGGSTATVTGTVKHFETEEVLAGATVVVAETGQTALSDATGKFTLIIATPGNYQLRVEKAGFRTYTEDTMVIEAGFEYTIDFELEPEEVQ